MWTSRHWGNHWAARHWAKRPVGAPVPDQAPAGGGRPRRRYPRRISIDGKLYWVRNPEEERALLKAHEEAAREALARETEQHGPTSVEAKRAARRIVVIEKRIAAVDGRESEWEQFLRQEDEELVAILMLH